MHKFKLFNPLKGFNSLFIALASIAQMNRIWSPDGLIGGYVIVFCLKKQAEHYEQEPP